MNRGESEAAIRGNAANSALMGVLAPIIPWLSAVSGAISEEKALSDSHLRSSLI
jgi:hypothetical protein